MSFKWVWADFGDDGRLSQQIVAEKYGVFLLVECAEPPTVVREARFWLAAHLEGVLMVTMVHILFT